MKLSQLDYSLPQELIAHLPITPRDHSKLMVINRDKNTISHKHFYDLPDLLTPNDVLVFNQTKVFPARLFGQKATGGKIELLLIKEIKPNTWSAIHKGKISIGQVLQFPDAKATVTKKTDSGIEIIFDVLDFWEWLYAYGQVPTPPYIDTKLNDKDIREKYQTVYAKYPGSVAAPTAGFHFTDELLKKLKYIGVQFEYVTLHVGLGTFLPIKTDDLTKHEMHSERFTLSNESALRLNELKASRKRIIAVGTTTTRVLESCTYDDKLEATTGETNIFIYPPYKFKFVDSLITNFHLPHSTLLALVSALVSKPNTDKKFIDFKSSLMGKAYEEAVNNHYRFYSFGDSSIIL